MNFSGTTPNDIYEWIEKKNNGDDTYYLNGKQDTEEAIDIFQSLYGCTFKNVYRLFLYLRQHLCMRVADSQSLYRAFIVLNNDEIITLRLSQHFSTKDATKRAFKRTGKPNIEYHLVIDRVKPLNPNADIYYDRTLSYVEVKVREYNLSEFNDRGIRNGIIDEIIALLTNGTNSKGTDENKENKIDNIITECICRYLSNNVIQEGYSSYHFSQQISEIVEQFLSFKTMVDRIIEKTGYYYQMWQGYGIKISLKPFFSNIAAIPAKYRRNKEYYVRINYNNKDEGHFVSGGYNPKLLHKTDFQIQLNVPFNATYQDIYTTLQHETTHLIDDIIQECKGYKSYVYPNQQMEDARLPKYARMLLYSLWTNTEFNAWQASYKQVAGEKDWLDVLMSYLDEAYKSNNIAEWSAIQQFVALKTKSKKIQGKSIAVFKDYFIKTTFKKLKKMVKKYY